MADSLTIKQEKFAQKFVETGNASEAYRHAYNAENSKPETVWRKAVEVLENGKVAARVDELKAEHAKRHAVTVDSLTQTLREAIALANQVEQPSAIVAAVKELGTLHGIRVEKNETKMTHEGALDLLK